MVVVIIGVLVAIAVPVYLNYRQGAADKSAQSDVRGAISAVEQYYTNNSNTYPANAAGYVSQSTSPITLTATTGGSAGIITLSDKTVLTYYLATSGTTYKLCANNTGGSTNKYYTYDSSTGGSVTGITSTTFSMATCS